jgi:hypothetical protein
VSDEGPPYIPGKHWYLGPRVVVRAFTCACCGAECQTTTTEAEANREYLESGQTSGSGVSSVCDDCYPKLMAYAREKGLL